MATPNSRGWTFPDGKASASAEVSKLPQMTMADVGIAAIGRQALGEVRALNMGRVATGLENKIIKAPDAGANVDVAPALSATVARMVATGIAGGKGIDEFQAQMRDGLREIRSLAHVDSGSILDFVVKSASPFPALGLLAWVGLKTANLVSPSDSDLSFAGIGERARGGLETARGGLVVNTSTVQLVGDVATVLVQAGADQGGGRGVLLLVESSRIAVLPDVTAPGLGPLGCSAIMRVRRATKPAGLSVVHLRESRDREPPAGASKQEAGPLGGAAVPKDEAATHFSEGRSMFMSESRHRSAEPLRKAALLGHAEAKLLHAWLQLNGCGVPKDEKAAAAAFDAGAKQGNVFAKAAMGWCLACGLGCARDITVGVKLARESAEAGCGLGMGVWGLCLFYGFGCAWDAVEAANWYQKAADAGEPWAMYRLGCAIRNGWGVPENQKQGLSWLRKAGQLGEPGAMYILSLCTPADESRRWLKAAALNGLEETQQKCQELGISLA